MSLLSEIKGWSPVIHSLAKQDGIGLITAAVWGAVWRYCQMDDKVCTASLETIGADLGIDKATVLRHIKKLCERGYLRDETPGLRNVTHTYSDTGKVKLTGIIEAQTVAHSNATVAERNSLSKSVAHSNATVAHSNATVAESQLNKDINRLSEKSVKSAHTDKILSDNRSFGIKLTQLCGYADPEFVINGKLTDCSAAVAQLVAWGATVEQLDAFKAWWWGATPPTFKQVVEEWGKFKAGASPDKPATPGPALDPAKLAAYQALRAEAEQAQAETAAAVNAAMAEAHTYGIDIQQQIRKGIRKIK
jgi:DNA-binding MarR family transcriptional regulator